MSLMSDRSKEVREKYKKLQQNYMHASTENKFLMEECTKRKYIVFLKYSIILLLETLFFLDSITIMYF